jgi:hypothetical protein
MYNIVLLHANYQGVVQHFGEAAEWQAKVMPAGSAIMMYAMRFTRLPGLGQGRGVIQNYVEVLKWDREGVEEGWATGIHEAVVRDLGNVLKCNAHQTR